MIRLRTVLSVFSLSAWICSNAFSQSIGFSITDASTPDHLNVTVLDEATQTPIAGAQVSITDSIGFGTPIDRMKSDGRGEVWFSNRSPAPKTVTVTGVGYATLSVVGVETGAMTAYLHPIATNVQTVLSTGTINGWTGVGEDTSIAHAGLVFQTVSALDLLNFQISNFVSPLKDKIDLGIIGKKDVPSNIVIPKQDVSYSFFTITLDKPNYRLPIPAGQTLGLTGVEVAAHVDDLVTFAQNKQYNVSILNKIEFQRIGVTAPFTANKDIQNNVDASQTLTPAHTVTIAKMPPFQADVIAASFTDQNGDKSMLVPSDVKAIYSTVDGGDPQSVTLGSPQSTDASKRAVAAVAVAGKGLQLSGVLISSAGQQVQAGEFLNTEALPQGQALPTNVAARAPSEGVSATIFETDQPVWYVYTLPVAGTVNIPTAKLSAILKISRYSVNQMEFDGFNPKSVDGNGIMSRLQRFARSSAKLAK